MITSCRHGQASKWSRAKRPNGKLGNQDRGNLMFYNLTKKATIHFSGNQISVSKKKSLQETGTPISSQNKFFSNVLHNNECTFVSTTCIIKIIT
jgi:hypothetical protein